MYLICKKWKGYIFIARKFRVWMVLRDFLLENFVLLRIINLKIYIKSMKCLV